MQRPNIATVPSLCKRIFENVEIATSTAFVDHRRHLIKSICRFHQALPSDDEKIISYHQAIIAEAVCGLFEYCYPDQHQEFIGLLTEVTAMFDMASPTKLAADEEAADGHRSTMRDQHQNE